MTVRGWKSRLHVQAHRVNYSATAQVARARAPALHTPVAFFCCRSMLIASTHRTWSAMSAAWKSTSAPGSLGGTQLLGPRRERGCAGALQRWGDDRAPLAAFTWNTKFFSGTSLGPTVHCRTSSVPLRFLMAFSLWTSGARAEPPWAEQQHSASAISVGPAGAGQCHASEARRARAYLFVRKECGVLFVEVQHALVEDDVGGDPLPVARLLPAFQLIVPSHQRPLDQLGRCLQRRPRTPRPTKAHIAARVAGFQPSAATSMSRSLKFGSTSTRGAGVAGPCREGKKLLRVPTAHHQCKVWGEEGAAARTARAER